MSLKHLNRHTDSSLNDGVYLSILTLRIIRLLGFSSTLSPNTHFLLNDSVT